MSRQNSVIRAYLEPNTYQSNLSGASSSLSSLHLLHTLLAGAFFLLAELECDGGRVTKLKGGQLGGSGVQIHDVDDLNKYHGVINSRLDRPLGRNFTGGER